MDSFLVRSEVSLILEAFSTVRANKRSVFWIVGGQVVFQTVRSSERFLTNITDVGPLVCVELDVVPQGGLVSERLGAGGADVRSLSGVNPEVLFEVRQAGKGLIADCASMTGFLRGRAV